MSSIQEMLNKRCPGCGFILAMASAEEMKRMWGTRVCPSCNLVVDMAPSGALRDLIIQGLEFKGWVIPNAWPALADRVCWGPPCWPPSRAGMRCGREIPSARARELAAGWCGGEFPPPIEQMAEAYRLLVPSVGYQKTLVEQVMAAVAEIDRLTVELKLAEDACRETMEETTLLRLQLKEEQEAFSEVSDWLQEMGWSFVFGDPGRKAAREVERFLRAAVLPPGGTSGA